MLLALLNQEAFDKLSEPLKKEYKKQDDGSYLLDVGPVNDFVLENVKGLKSALSSERSLREKLEGSLKAFDGLDSAKAREALKKIEDLAKGGTDDKTKEQIEALKKQLTEKHTGELSQRDDSINKLTKQLEKLLVEAAAVKAIAENKGNVELLLPHVRNTTRMKKLDNGDYTVEIVDDKGNARITNKTGSTDPMTISELVSELKGNKTFAPAFSGSGASGSGADNHTGGKSGIDLDKMTPEEKLRYARQQQK
ncbi:MAG: hypothetical protein ABFD91_02860 [Anaerohalosphaeraceae bacterium]